jgi:hypothetical protein
MNTPLNFPGKKTVPIWLVYFMLGLFVVGFAFILFVLLEGTHSSIPTAVLVLMLAGCVFNSFFWIYYIARVANKDKGL